jgi:hypothetical protein
MMITNEWTYNGNLFTSEQTEGFYGFVYLITNTDNNRKYIGRKYFTKAKTTQLKGKKKRSRVGSGWEDYWGSNKVLVEEIAVQGKEKYRREILHLCKSRSECSYMETFEIFNRSALLSESYYNSWVTCKIHKSHVIGKIDGTKTNSKQ